MDRSPRIIIIAKQREFDEEKWKQLLMATAYLLHEQRKSQAAEPNGSNADAQTMP